MRSISKAPSSSNEVAEESGWTTYFEDFFNDDNKCPISSGGVPTNSSLVSDAASLAATKKLGDDREVPGDKNGKRSLSFKKRKKPITSVFDDALEDTASSPLSSPKVSYANLQLDKKPTKKEELRLSQEKGSSSGQGEERKELGFIGRDSDCTELKKRGLCLVPLSMVVNYLG